jgi:hypothetical protein
MRRGIAVVLVVGALAGCKAKEESGDDGRNLPPVDPVTASEAETGRKACAAYVAQVCACAADKPDLKSECEMAKARPQAFEMNTRAAMAEGDASSKDRRILIANSRKIMRACIEDGAALAKQGCPMAAPGAATPAPPAPAPAP